MKLYSEYKKSSISMANDDRLFACLKTIADKHEVNIIIESGTYLGTGSTLVLANAFATSSALVKFYSCEVNKKFYKQAKSNLINYPIVTCLHGRTVSLQKAKEFIATDEAIANHESYPGIYIDDVVDPVKFYTQELEGNLHLNIKESKFIRHLKSFFPVQEQLLAKLIKRFSGKCFLIVLDSAGGIGYFEFLTVLKLLKQHKYYLLLDDIHHLKHFRSFEYVKESDAFELINFDISNGWALAYHKSL